MPLKLNTHDSYYGPASELIDIPKFIQDARTLHPRPLSPDSLDQIDDAVAEACSVSELRQELEHAYNQPAVSSYLLKLRDHNTMSVYSVATGAKGRRKTAFPKGDATSAVIELRKNMEEIKLSSYKRSVSDQVPFIRATKYTDQNTISRLLKTPSADPNHGALGDDAQVMLTISILNKIGWASGGLTGRASQHVLLSSQTLSVLCKTVLCPSSNYHEDRTPPQGHPNQTGFVVCIDDAVYGDGYESDFADKLIEHLSLTKSGSVVARSPTSLSETEISSLSLRIGQPYWMMHKGNCEHFFVVDQIRLQHSLDPRDGYPLTTQISPPLLDLCRACCKVPAAVSVNGDVRLGESPCLLCSPCWGIMGDSDAPGVSVINLPIWPE